MPKAKGIHVTRNEELQTPSARIRTLIANRMQRSAQLAQQLEHLYLLSRLRN